MHFSRKFLLLNLAFAIPFSAVANVMTFDPLGPDFTEYSSYVEDGITLFAADGAPEHFHADTSAAGTGATIFGDDGSPQEVVFAGGLFDLVSVDVFGFTPNTSVRIISSTGGAQIVGSAGTVTLGFEFRGIAWARFVFEPTTTLDPYFTLDNITVQSSSVPDFIDASLGLGIGITGLLAFRHRPGRAVYGALAGSP